MRLVDSLIGSLIGLLIGWLVGSLMVSLEEALATRTAEPGFSTRRRYPSRRSIRSHCGRSTRADKILDSERVTGEESAFDRPSGTGNPVPCRVVQSGTEQRRFAGGAAAGDCSHRKNQRPGEPGCNV